MPNTNDMSRDRKVKRIIGYLVFSVIASLVLILTVELCLRIFFGYPKCLFDNITSGFFPKNSTIKLKWGIIPFTVKTNQLGLRGKAFPLNKPEGSIRIMAVGDSVTVGFYVDNEDTYPCLLEELLNERVGEGKRNIEVINGARGKASIDLEYLMIKELAIPLQADAVLLMFTTNDIAEIAAYSGKELLSLELEKVKALTTTELILTKTAIGEIAFDLYLRNRSIHYRAHERIGGYKTGENKYRIKGGDNFAANAKIFIDRFKMTDGLVLKEPLSARTVKIIDNYLFALEHVNNTCRENNITLFFIYFPAYNQVYDVNASMKIKDALKDACNKFAIPFIDLTEPFRIKGKNKVLHFAPEDFHPNPDGNKVVAEGIADFLIKNNFFGSFPDD